MKEYFVWAVNQVESPQSSLTLAEFELPTAVTIKSTIFSGVIPCIPDYAGSHPRR
jgi:hypothetical protein